MLNTEHGYPSRVQVGIRAGAVMQKPPVNAKENKKTLADGRTRLLVGKYDENSFSSKPLSLVSIHAEYQGLSIDTPQCIFKLFI